MQRQKAKQSVINLFRRIPKLPLKFWVISCVIVLIIIYILAFVAPVQVSYSFSSKQYCINKILFLPDSQKQTTGNNEFKITKANVLKVGGANLVSTRICFSPNTSPRTGNTNIGLSPFGGIIFAKSFNVTVGKIPKLETNFANNTPQALSKPLEFNLDSADGLFDYKISIDDRSIPCKNNSKTISCDISELKLEQGETYSYKLIRLFNTETSQQFDGVVDILAPTTITSTSVSENEIVYSKPKQFTITTDKTIKSADVSIVNISNNLTTEIESTTTISDKIIYLSIASDLQRKSDYRIIVSSIEATDGSTLVATQNINFKTSGGPAVSNVNIGSSGVDPNATIVITFDQPIDSDLDVSRFVGFSGGNFTISRTSRTISLRLNSLGLCRSFTISVYKGLTSNYGIASDSSWSYTSRTSCRVATEVIGHSVKGRSILAYYYGTGSTTILFTGGIHGSEPSGKYLLDDWIAYLDSNGYLIPADKRIVIVPNLNPDGIATYSRYNSNRVNIDRNFDTTNWTGDIDTGAGIIIGGGGSSAMSEPETQAIASLTARLQPRLEISYHAQGSLVGANQYGDSIAIGNLYASNIGYSSMIGVAEEVMGYSITGEYEDWMGEKYGIPAILIELPGSTGRYFWTNLSTIWKIVNL